MLFKVEFGIEKGSFLEENKNCQRNLQKKKKMDVNKFYSFNNNNNNKINIKPKRKNKKKEKEYHPCVLSPNFRFRDSPETV